MDYGSMTWTHLAERLKSAHSLAVLMPLGAVEAHGPHLPLDTDTVIAERLADEIALRLRGEQHLEAIRTASVTATAASWAADFPGTFSLAPDAARAVLRDSIEPLRRAGATRLMLVSLHFDPAHVAAVREVVDRFHGNGFKGLVYPDFTRRAHAQRIGGEFATGACHGGEFETSLLLAADAGKVHEGYRKLPRLDVNLAAAIREGKKSFREVGLHDAYCGDPAAATAEEGRRLYAVLASIAMEEGMRAWSGLGSGAP